MFDWIDRLEVINKHLILIDRTTDKLSKHKTICKVMMYSQYPKSAGNGLLLKKVDKAKTLKSVKSIFKRIEKAHRNDKVEKEPSGNK